MKKLSILFFLTTISCFSMDNPKEQSSSGSKSKALKYVTYSDLFRGILNKPLKDLDKEDAQQNRPLETALLSADEEAAQNLLKEGTSIRQKTVTIALLKRSSIPLLAKIINKTDHTLIKNNHKLLFLALKHEINQLTYFPEECCHSLTEVTIFPEHTKKTSLKPRPEVIKLLLNNGASINVQYNNRSPLHYALLLEAPKSILEVLLTQKPEINSPDQENNYPLHLFLKRQLKVDELTLIRKLCTIENCNKNDKDGFKPLDRATQQADEQVRQNLETILKRFGATQTICKSTCDCSHCQRCPFKNPLSKEVSIQTSSSQVHIVEDYAGESSEKEDDQNKTDEWQLL